MSESATRTAVLRTALGKHRIADLLRDGSVADPAVDLDFVDVEPIHRAFAPMVRDQAYDVSELAVVTALQAIAYGHPIALLPIVVAARFQRKCIISHERNPITDPAQLRGKRVGVRSYTQTTGLWIRQHLQEDSGIEASDIEWITQDPAHVPEYVEPPYVHRTLEGGLVDALRSGDIDAAILGNDLPSGDEFVPVIDHPADRDHAWYLKHGYVPVNHLVSISSDVLEQQPDTVRAVWDMLVRAEAQASADQDVPVTMAGLDRLAGPIDEIAAACHAQGMLPRPITSDEVFAPIRQVIAN
jgi:4,5-dihydroxyphthalate decarboxylase